MILRPRDALALDDWAALLRDRGSLPAGAPLPLRGIGSSEIPTRLPDDVGAYAEGDAVVALSARRAGLESVPGSLAELADLESLDLTGNRLTSLPSSIGGITRLRRLHLDGNQLASLPEEVVALARLEELHLDGNPLARLPDGLGRLQALRTLSDALRSRPSPRRPGASRSCAR
ncbi:MAG: hypothetical protein DMF77_13025 [Acidobacteria bacterium]|nr:MAG: hypothetical protein DMF77_13025 [Acidobacteriota bacterium]